MKKFKKSLLLVLSFALVAVVSVTSTLAYLSAQDNEANVFTAGQVDVELIEQQRNADKTALEKFEQGKELLPIVGSAQGEKDKFGLPTAANYVDKIVTVANTGRNDAWVRVLFGFPQVLDAATADKMPLHWNHSVTFDADGNYVEGNKIDYNWKSEGLAYTIEIEGVVYNVYSYTYKTPLAAGTTTPDPAIVGLYLDSRVNYDADLGEYTIDYGEGPVALEGFDGNVVMPVVAQAVQYDGFEASADAAFEAAFPVNTENLTKWFNDLGVEVARPAKDAVRPAGYVVTGENEIVDGLVVIDGSDENTNLRAIYNGESASDYVKGNLTIRNSYLDGTYAMNVYGDKTGDLVVEDTALRGWVSYSGFKTATFTNVTFGANTNPGIYNVVRPYSTVVFKDCAFDGTKFYFDYLPDDATVTFENCTMNGKKIASQADITVDFGTKTNTVIYK